MDLTTDIPFFSIVIPCYNRAELLQRALDSCTAQLYSNFEVIVVDDGSVEDLALVVNALDDPRIKLVRQVNSGANSARNLGICMARGEWIALLDADDYFLPEKLKVIESYVRENDVDMVVSRASIKRSVGNGWATPDQLYSINDELTEFMFCRYQVIPTSTFVIKTTVARENLMDESLVIGEDIEYIVRLAACGKNIHMLPQVLVVYVDTGGAERLSRGADGLILDSWVERNRHLFSEKGYYGYRGSYLSKHIGWSRPVKAFRDLVLGYIKGGMTLRLTLRRFVRAYFPKIYDFLVGIFLYARSFSSAPY